MGIQLTTKNIERTEVSSGSDPLVIVWFVYFAVISAVSPFERQLGDP